MYKYSSPTNIKQFETNFNQKEEIPFAYLFSLTLTSGGCSGLYKNHDSTYDTVAIPEMNIS